MFCVVKLIIYLQEPVGVDGESNPKQIGGGDKCNEAFTLFQETPSVLGASSNEVGSARKVSDFKEFVPPMKTLADNEPREFNDAEGHNRNHKPDKSDVVMVQNDSGEVSIATHPT